MSSKTRTRDYGRLKELLEKQEKFPLQFTFKIIGKNTTGFANGIRRFESQFPKMLRQSEKESSEGGHLSITYTLLADSAVEITWIYEQASEIEDVHILL